MLILAFVFSVPASAHSSSLSTVFDTTTRDGATYIGVEAVGWLLNEAYHTNVTTLQYKFAAGVDFDIIQIVNEGAELWSNPFTVEFNSAGKGTVMYYSAIPPSAISACHYVSANSSGHLTAWQIWINPNKTQYLTSAIIAHEFGHAYGLADLYKSSNSNKLMYGIADDSNSFAATAPTSTDIKGAKTITGYHHVHVFQYVNYTTGRHRHRCNVCGGFKSEYCTYNSNIVCTKCGVPGSISPDNATSPMIVKKSAK